jgi:hypothetical protein
LLTDNGFSFPFSTMTVIKDIPGPSPRSCFVQVFVLILMKFFKLNSRVMT